MPPDVSPEQEAELLAGAQAVATIHHPHEIWEQESNTAYLRRYGASESMVAWAETDEQGRLITFVPQDGIRRMARHQKGNLKWSREKKK